MASTQQYLVMENPDDVETFFLMFDSKLSIESITKDDEKVLKLISVVGLDALKKIRKLCLPKQVTEMSYDEIKKRVIGYVKPGAKLIWAERTKFFSLRQQRNEKLVDFATRLRNQVRNCSFEALKQSSNIDEALVVNQLICGIESKVHQEKILEHAATKTPSVNSVCDLVKNLLEITRFCDKPPNAEVMTISRPTTDGETSECMEIRRHQRQFKVGKRCSFCGNSWHDDLKLCPARNVICRSCNKKGHFAKSCKHKTAVLDKQRQRRGHVNNVGDIFHITETNFIRS